MRINWFTVLILVLMAKSLMQMDFLQVFCGALVVFTCLPVHEFAHGYMANKLGDPTAEMQGRLTLNPFAHLDFVGTIMILFMGFGWAKPVPVNPRYFRNERAGMAMTAFAGPLANLIMAFIATVMLRFAYYPYALNKAWWAEPVFVILQTFVIINVSLALFNLLPVHPLDGSRILAYFLPAHCNRWIEDHSEMISLVMMAVIFLTDLVSVPLSWLAGHVFDLLLAMTEFIDPFARMIAGG